MAPAVQKPELKHHQEKETSRPVSSAILAWGSVALAVAESICVAAVGLSGIRVAIGLTSLIAAGGPATGFHREGIRIPLLALGTIGALLTLLLLWNEQRLRKNPAAAWRIQPFTPGQSRRRRLELWLAIVTLVLVAAELVTHPWFHLE